MRCFIVLPCFNEEKNVKPLIYSIDHVLKNKIPYKIIAVNDGSRDLTCKVLKDLSADYSIRVVEHHTNMGLGVALRSGLLAATEEVFDDDVVITMDSDNTHDPKHILGMLAASKKADIVVGSRYVEGGSQLNVPSHRVVLSKFINTLIGKLFRLPVKDTTSGFRCFRAILLKRLCVLLKGSIIDSKGFESSLELLFKAVYLGGFPVEIPILLDYGKKGGKSKLRIFSTILNYLILLFKFRRLLQKSNSRNRG